MLQSIKLFLLLSFLLLTGCGGGSSGSDSEPPEVSDTQPPVITISGENPTSIGYNKTYEDAGATANDDVDGSVTIVVTSDVDTSTIGSYTVTYAATDKAGNSATASRTVNVIDDVAPNLSLSSNLNLEILQGSVFIQPSAVANDEIDGVINVTVTGSVDTATIGTYQLTYSAVDSSGNETEAILNVEVVRQPTNVDITYFGDGTIDANQAMSCSDFKLCTIKANVGDMLQVTATPSPGSKLALWEGCDTVNGNVCHLKVTQESLLDATFSSENPMQINSDVIHLSEAQIRQITDYTENGVITFDRTMDITSFEVGKILVSTGIYLAAGDPNNVEIYFARRIRQIISLPGSSIIIETTEASLADIIDEGTLSFDAELGADNVDISRLTSGITLDRARIEQMNMAAGYNSVNNVIPFQIDVKVGDMTVKGSVDLSIDPDLDVDFSIVNIIDEFKFHTRVNTTSNISVLVGASGEKLFEDELPLGNPIYFSPVVIGPVIFLPKLQFFLQSSVDVDFGWEPKVTVVGRMVGGAHYIHGKGWHKYSQKTGSVSANVLTPENVTAKISASAGPGAELGLYLYGLVGPKLGVVGSGGVEAFYVPNSSACKIDFNLIYKASGKFAGEFKLLSKKLKYEAKLFEVSKIKERFSRDCPANKPDKPIITEITDITDSSVKVNWKTNSEDPSLLYRVLRDYVDLGIETSNMSFVDNGLAPDTTYCYNIVAVNNSPEHSEPSDEMCVKTEAEDLTVPNTPSLLSATAVSSRSIELSWAQQNDADAFIVYEIGQSGNYIAQEQVTTSNAVVGGLVADTEYCFTVTAIDANGNESDFTSQACATTKTAEEAVWDIFIACVGRDYQVTAKLDLDEEYSSAVSVVGTGNDYGGTALAFNLYGIYGADTGILNADINWTFEGSSSVRKERFSANLSTGDSGDVPMEFVVDNGGCDAVIRFIKDQPMQSGVLPAPSWPMIDNNQTLLGN